MRYIRQVCDAIDEVPVTVFCKGAYFARHAMRQLNCNTIGLDWNMEIAESRRIIGDEKTLQGNLDPCALYGTPAQVANATKQMLDQFGTSRHIANLGHGVYPDINPDMVKVFVETVKEYSAKLRT
jgi:uroporphyrinogen decarboxylase